jgi:tetrahydromethanopterin S-methyltransferase subunit G
MLGTRDESKVGYFKVRKGARKRNKVGVIIGIVVGLLFGVFVIGVGICVRKMLLFTDKTKQEREE